MWVKFTHKIPTIRGLALGFSSDRFDMAGELVDFHDFSETLLISNKEGAYIGGAAYIEFVNSGGEFNVNDSIGLGICFNNAPKFFATCNDKLLGKNLLNF